MTVLFFILVMIFQFALAFTTDNEIAHWSFIILANISAATACIIMEIEK